MIITILYRNLTNLTKLLSATKTLPTKTLPTKRLIKYEMSESHSAKPLIKERLNPTKLLPTKTLIKYEMSESHSAKPLIKERLICTDNKYPHYTIGK